MTELEFYDLVADRVQLERNSIFGSTPYMSLKYKNKEIRVKYRKSQSCVRLDIINKVTTAKYVDGYEINPKDKTYSTQKLSNISIYKDIDLDDNRSLNNVIDWIKEFIPKLYEL